MKPLALPVALCLGLMTILGSRATLADQVPLACPAPNAEPISPDAVHGIVTRIHINPKAARSMAYSIQPALQDQDLATWIRQLEEKGVNIAELLLLPSDRLAADQTIPSADWQAYIDAALLPFSERSPAQQSIYNTMRDRIGGRNGVKNVTAEQQDQVLLAFLGQLETLKNKGRICGNIQFIVAERRWFPTGSLNPQSVNKRLSSEVIYAQTMADFVNKAVEAHLGHWLAGMLFAEHTNTDMSQVLPITVDLAVRINALTHDWLRSHLMIAAGGGFGDQFNGIDNAKCPADGDSGNASYQFTCRPGKLFDFFGLITQQTGSFAFGYKLFNWRTAPTLPSFCTSYRGGCDPKNMTVVNWTAYLSDSQQGLGFGDLATYVNRNAAAYPAAANVIFIGNAADSLFKMVETAPGQPGDRLVPQPGLIALTTLFQGAAQKGGGWSGRLFMDAYGDRDRLADDLTAPDSGAFLFYVDRSPFDLTGNGQVTVNRQSLDFWRAWPRLPPTQ